MLTLQSVIQSNVHLSTFLCSALFTNHCIACTCGLYPACFKQLTSALKLYHTIIVHLSAFSCTRSMQTLRDGGRVLGGNKKKRKKKDKKPAAGKSSPANAALERPPNGSEVSHGISITLHMPKKNMMESGITLK